VQPITGYFAALKPMKHMRDINLNNRCSRLQLIAVCYRFGFSFFRFKQFNINYMKTYVLTVSVKFPKTHKKSGQATYFTEQILGKFPYDLPDNSPSKIHTIRANYPLWAKRISEIQNGKAILSIRYWSDKPYNSKQVEICQLDKNSGIGIQLLNLSDTMISGALKNHDVALTSLNGGLSLSTIAKNDGLSLEDFKEWFKGYDLSQSMAIIHFTSFRY